MFSFAMIGCCGYCGLDLKSVLKLFEIWTCILILRNLEVYPYFLITFLVILSLTYIYVLGGAISLQAMWIDYETKSCFIRTSCALI